MFCLFQTDTSQHFKKGQYLKVCSPQLQQSNIVSMFWVPTCSGGRGQFGAVSAAALVRIEALKNRSKPPLQVISGGH